MFLRYYVILFRIPVFVAPQSPFLTIDFLTFSLISLQAHPPPPTPVEAPQLQASISHSSAEYFFRQIAHSNYNLTEN